jgi:hypothetical protein
MAIRLYYKTIIIVIYIIVKYPASREKQNGGKTEFTMFCKQENGKLLAFYRLHRIKNTMKKLPQIFFRLANQLLKFKMVKNIYF